MVNTFLISQIPQILITPILELLNLCYSSVGFKESLQLIELEVIQYIVSIKLTRDLNHLPKNHVF